MAISKLLKVKQPDNYMVVLITDSMDTFNHMRDNFKSSRLIDDDILSEYKTYNLVIDENITDIEADVLINNIQNKL